MVEEIATVAALSRNDKGSVGLPMILEVDDDGVV